MIPNKEDKALIPRPTAEAMARAYAEAKADIEEAFQHLDRAQEALQKAYLTEASFLPYKLTYYNTEQVIEDVKRHCWYRIVDLLQLPSFMPTRKAEQLAEQIRSGDVPEITLQSILDFCAGVYAGLNDLFGEMIEETAKWLQPSKWGKSYKTNEGNKYEISRKVIKSYCTEPTYGKATARLRDYAEQKLQVMDNVFSLLDGKGTSKYPGNLVTAIRDAAEKGKWEAETPYFHVRWFKNGNLHITFLREDLLQEFNKRAGEGKIRPRQEEA